MTQLSVDEPTCKGHGLCFFGWPDLFDLREDGIATVLVDDVEGNQVIEARRAVAACPEHAIHLDGGDA
jgi:ferredoxin